MRSLSAVVDGDTGEWYLFYAKNIPHGPPPVVFDSEIKSSPRAEDMAEEEVEGECADVEEEHGEYMEESVDDVDNDSTKLSFY